jgi:hypothetical protein
MAVRRRQDNTQLLMSIERLHSRRSIRLQVAVFIYMEIFTQGKADTRSDNTAACRPGPNNVSQTTNRTTTNNNQHRLGTNTCQHQTLPSDTRNSIRFTYSKRNFHKTHLISCWVFLTTMKILHGLPVYPIETLTKYRK